MTVRTGISAIKKCEWRRGNVRMRCHERRNTGQMQEADGEKDILLSAGARDQATHRSLMGAI